MVVTNDGVFGLDLGSCREIQVGADPVVWSEMEIRLVDIVQGFGGCVIDKGTRGEYQHIAAVLTFVPIAALALVNLIGADLDGCSLQLDCALIVDTWAKSGEDANAVCAIDLIADFSSVVIDDAVVSR